MLQIGSLLGCVLAGVMIERLGRRFTMRLVASLSFLSGYLVITLADSAALIMLGTMQQHLAPLKKLIIGSERSSRNADVWMFVSSLSRADLL